MNKIKYLMLEAFTSRKDVSIDDPKRSFSKESATNGYDSFAFDAGFWLFDDRDWEDDDDWGNNANKAKVAMVKLAVFDDDAIKREKENIFYVANVLYGGIVQDAMEELIKSSTNKYRPHRFTGVIDNLYVYPEYRGLGACRYILDNLAQIFMYCFNVRLGNIVAFPWPMEPCNGDIGCDWEDSLDESMVQRIKRILECAGFSKLGNLGYYVRNYELEA